jgi:hypothetical protein
VLTPRSFDQSSQMINGLNSAHGFPDRIPVVHISNYEAHMQFLKRMGIAGVSHEARNLVSPLQQRFDQVSPYEACSASDKHTPV